MMIQNRNILAGAAVALAFGLPGGLFGADPVAPHITAAIGSFARDMAEKTRDPEMKPAEVLTLAEVKSGGAIVNLNPGDGYWTKLFSKAVGNQGHVYPLVPIRGYLNYAREKAGLAALAASQGKPAPLDPMKVSLQIQFVTDFKNVKAISELIDWFGGNFGIPEQADLIFTSTGYNDFHNKVPGDLPTAMGPYDMTKINRAIYRAMKPGSVYMISDYAAAPGSGFSATESLHRADPEAVKTELTGAGFEFVGSSDMYANPADDHTKPADPANKPDKYILKFRKPRNAPIIDKRPKGEVLAKWQRNWLDNTMVQGTLEAFPGAMYYHADLTVQEEGGNPNATVLLGTYYWDVEGHNCQYHESPSDQGLVFCHALDSPESLNAEPGGYEWAYLNGAPDQKVQRRVMVKGMVRAKPRAGRGGADAPGAGQQ